MPPSLPRSRCGVFSSDDHQPIVYPLALTPTGAAHPGARAFYDFLKVHRRRAVLQAGFQTTATAASGVPAWRGRIDVPQGSYGPITLSLWVAASSLLLSLVPGVAIGWLLARRAFFGRTALLIMVMVPLVLPPVVTGYLLLQLFGRHGLFAPVLATLGLEVAFGRWGAVLAAAVVGFPLLVQVTRQAFEAVDPRYEHIASTLGRHPVSVFFTVTLPMAAPGIAAGAVLAFARGLGVGATAVLAGDVPGETRTIALALFAAYEQPGQEAAASQLVWIAVALSSAALVGLASPVLRQAGAPMTPHLEVQLRHQWSSGFELDVSFSTTSRAIALFGPSGAGKSTILSAIAGLLDAHEARIALAGAPLVDTEAGVCLPPRARRVGLVLQDAWLFPLLRVRHNLAYGQPRGTTRFSVAEIAERPRSPTCWTAGHATSQGGERQRVWPWVAPSCRSRRCCSATSPSAASTPLAEIACCPCSAASTRPWTWRLWS